MERYFKSELPDIESSSSNAVERFMFHASDVNTLYKNLVKQCEDMLRQDQLIHVDLEKQSDKHDSEYRIRLGYSLALSEALLSEGLSSHGSDDSEGSLNIEDFLELLQFLEQLYETICRDILADVPWNYQMISQNFQKEIIKCFGQEVLKQVFEDLGDDVFSLLVDGSDDRYESEQMDVVIRYVDKFGVVKERFIGIVHAKETSALSFRSAIDDLFARYELDWTKVRGQSYDGVTNMVDEFNGLKALILQENHSAYNVHCFAYEFQLVVVAVARKHVRVWKFFETISTLTNVVCASCTQHDMFRESQREKLEEAIGHLEIDTGSDLIKKLSLERVGDTRWNSHYKTLTHLVSSYASVVEVLEYIEKAGDMPEIRMQAYEIHIDLKTFESVFYLHLMMHILEITDILSQCLQRKDQDLLNAISLVNSTKLQLQTFRLEGFDSLLEEVNSFCDKHDAEMINMNANYIDPRKPRQKTNITYYDHYEFDCFNTVLDMQIEEFENRFNKVTSELLMNVSSLSPRDNFIEFNIPKIIRLADMYPYDFNEDDKRRLKLELPNYIDNLKADTRFANLNGLSTLVRLMVETKKHISFTLVYCLLKLSLVLPVATTSVERYFPAMKYVKSDLRKRIGDEYSNDSCICYIENELLRNVRLEDIIYRFLEM